MSKIILLSLLILAVLGALLLVGPKVIIVRIKTDNFIGGKLAISGSEFSIEAGSTKKTKLLRAKSESSVSISCPHADHFLLDDEGYILNNVHQFVYVELKDCEIEQLSISRFP